MSFALPVAISASRICSNIAARIEGDAQVLVSGITQDSRNVVAGDLYCCIRGEFFDGYAFIDEAIESGAVALLVDSPVSNIPSHICVITVDNVRDVLGLIAANGFSHPSQSLVMVGITGTNGKTSTASILSSIFSADGAKVRVFGTLTGERTTPEAIELQSLLAATIRDDVTHVVMEVSSHALHQGRVNGIKFDVGVLTNINRDHLDYHKTEEKYFAAKAMLFTPMQSKVGVVNCDDPRGQLIIDVNSIPMHPYSKSDAQHIKIGIKSVEFEWSGLKMVVPMGGTFTLMNTLAAISVAKVLKIDDAAIVAGCQNLSLIPGRFESVHNDQEIGVIVDYAHTPEGLEELLKSVRGVCAGKIILVFGCGGDRDTGKRSLMGKIASQLADVVFVTSDNPRTEDPRTIVEHVLSGVETQSTVYVELDREAAITSAIFTAQRGDVVVIAGKGHESTQEINGVRTPFSDVAVATKVLSQRKGATS